MSTAPTEVNSPPIFWAPAIGGGPRPPPSRPHRGARAAGALPRRLKHLPPPGVGLLIIGTWIAIPRGSLRHLRLARPSLRCGRTLPRSAQRDCSVQDRVGAPLGCQGPTSSHSEPRFRDASDRRRFTSSIDLFLTHCSGRKSDLLGAQNSFKVDKSKGWNIVSARASS